MSADFYFPGWVDDPDAVSAVAMAQPLPVFNMTPAAEVPEKDLPENVFLWKTYEQATGKPWPIRNQGQIGSCVSFGTVAAIEATLAAQKVAGSNTSVPDLVQEEIYGGARVEIGKKQLRGDGAVGAWGAQCAKQYGVINRGIHGSYDLTAYDVKRCREWGASGIPDDLEPACREHLVQAVTLVRSWDEARKALASGYGISVASSRGFKMARDRDGFCAPSGTWMHCMAIIGYRGGNRPGGFIVNSWGGDAHTGPIGDGNGPKSGFWAEDSVIDYMLRQGDSWAFSGVSGFPARRLDWVV